MKQASQWQTSVFAIWAFSSGIALFIPGPMKEVNLRVGENERWITHEVRDYAGLLVREVAVTFVGFGLYAAIHMHKRQRT